MLPTLFLNHGGGPLPLLGHQLAVASSIRNAAPLSGTPSAILVISAHYESSPLQILSQHQHTLLFDYYGFLLKAINMNTVHQVMRS
jgi:4,5-DOPA dioxygenase extradiol